MAIARVGKRFGVFDIRIGLPRDKGFDPVEASKRINQRANPQTTVNKFRALISSGEGLARSNKFIAVIKYSFNEFEFKLGNIPLYTLSTSSSKAISPNGPSSALYFQYNITDSKSESL